MAKKRKSRRQPANRARSSSPSAFTAVYFFLPLEAPLSIPDKSILRSQEKPPPKLGFEDDYLAVEWDDEEGLVGCRISCCFHQVTATNVDAAQFAAFEAARIAFPSLQPDHAPSEPVPLPVAVTVAEIAVHLAEHSDDAVDDALDEAVEFIADTQRAYCALDREPMPIMTRAKLPLLVPYAVREGIPGVHPSDWPKEPEIEFVMARPPKRGEYTAAPSDEHPARFSLGDLSNAGRPVLNGPFRHVHEAWRNANVAVVQGDHAVAAILAGVTCEQTVRALLLCLLWEEELDSAEAARVLYESNGNTKTVSSLLNVLFGRLTVSPDADRKAQAAARHALEMRNAVLHRSDRPAAAETRSALDRCAEFAEWTREATLASLDRYAVTAAMTITPTALDDATAARFDEALTSNLWPTRPNDNVRHYQIEIERHLPGNETKRTGKSERLPDGAWAMMSLAYPNGQVRWVGVDEQNWLAFLAVPP